MGILDAFFAQDAKGEQLRGGLLGMGAGLMSGANNMGGQFAPALAQGFAGMGVGMQNAQKNAMLQAEAQRKQQLQQLQMAMAMKLQGGGGSVGGGSPGGAGQVGGGAVGGAGGAQPSGMSFNDYQAMMALGVPGAKDAFDAYKYANPVQLQSGSTYRDPVTGQERYMPKMDNGIVSQNGIAMAMPGYADANAQIQGAATGAQESAKYPYALQGKRDDASLDLIEVPDGRGGFRMMPRSQAAQSLSSPPVGALPGGRLGASLSPADQAYDTEVAKASATAYNGIQESGRSANRQIASYTQIGKLLGDYEGGSLSGAALQAARLANSLGVKIDPNLPEKEAAVAIGNELALQLRDPSAGMGMPGSMSDADRSFLMQSVPSLSQSAKGRETLIGIKVKTLERNKEVAEAARKWKQQYGRLDATDPRGNDFQSALTTWANENPMFDAGMQSGGFSNLWGG